MSARSMGLEVAPRVIVFIVAIACLARVVHLNADPSVPTWIGYVVDEGRWSESARNFALFGNMDWTTNARLHLMLAPGYQAVQYAAFALFGIDFASARLFTAVCGILIVTISYLALRRLVTPFALTLGLVILGFETNLLAESRLALPEIPSLLFTLLAFLLLVLARKSPRNAFLAGAVATIAVAMKGTTLIIVPVFALSVLISPRGGPAKARAWRALAFTGGFAFPGFLALLVAAGTGGVHVASVASAGLQIVRFFQLATPYTAVSRFFDSTELEVCVPLLVGVWFCSWIWLHRDAGASPVTREVYIASGIWSAWWLVAWSVSQYLPGRYFVHWIVPATIHIMAGLSLARHDAITRIVATLRDRRGWQRPMLLAWLVLPMAVFVSTIAAQLAEIVDGSSSLSRRILWIVVIAGALALAAGKQPIRRNLVAAFLLSPVILTVSWVAARELGLVDDFWRWNTALNLSIRSATIALTFVACLMLAREPQEGRRLVVVKGGVIVVLAAIFVAEAAPAILRPSYSIRDASLALQTRFPYGATIRTFGAESLFLANTLQFRAVAPGETGYDGIVIFEHGVQSRLFLASPQGAKLVKVQSFPLKVNSRYRADEEKFGPPSVGVYRLP